ncbi:MAG: MFS transporter [Methylococcaceae bacterium]
MQPSPTLVFEKQLYRKLDKRLLPFLLSLYIVAYLDRVNISFAKLTMSAQLAFDDSIYALGAGIFFIGYFLFEIPSNLILQRVGARLWIARIMIIWGLLSALTAFVQSAQQFYAVRFFLGVGEAGFFPGIIFYLTHWYPAQRRAKATALFMTAVALAGVIGSPLSGAIMQYLQGFANLAGWQWLFLLEAAPALVLGVVVVFYLHDSPTTAPWLDDTEKRYLLTQLRLETEQKQRSAQHISGLGQVFCNAQVWLLSLIYFAIVMGLYGISFWLPQLIKNLGTNSLGQIGWLAAIPYACAAIGMVFIAHSSDKRHERRWHLVLCTLVASLSLVLSACFADSLFWAMLALSLACTAVLSALSIFWTLPTAFLSSTAAAAGIAFINASGNLAGYCSPFMVAWLQSLTGTLQSGLYFLAFCLSIAACLLLWILRPATTHA